MPANILKKSGKDPIENVLKTINNNNNTNGDFLNGEGLIGYAAFSSFSGTGFLYISKSLLYESIPFFILGVIGLLMIWDDWRNNQNILKAIFRIKS